MGNFFDNLKKEFIKKKRPKPKFVKIVITPEKIEDICEPKKIL